MKDNDLIFLAFVGIGAYIIWRNTSNPSPGAFDPSTPDTFSSLDILPQTVSSAGIEFIKQNESFVSTPTNGAIGYGHEILPGEDWSGGITREQASNLLDQDLIPVENTINNNVTVSISQNQFDALADFIYNVGVTAFLNSTLLSDLNAGNYAQASNDFSQWLRAGTSYPQGIANRRGAEQYLFNA